MRSPLAAVIVCLTVSAAMASMPADTRPFWTEQALFHFGDDVFFTGRASCAPSVEDGRQRAFVAAVQEIKNFTRAQEISGFPLTTQMIFEDPHPSDCAAGSVTVWRLVRAPQAALESLAKRSGPRRQEDLSPIVAQIRAIRNLTPRIGMLRDEVWHRYGLPRSILAYPDRGELVWDYSQFGLTVVFNQEDVLTRWRLHGPNPRSSDDKATDAQEKVHGEQTLPTIDLTARLQQLEEQLDLDRQHQAQRYCALRFANVPDQYRPKEGSCEQREYERLKTTPRPY
ncbi:hypothetical protein FBQ96_09095 [Nitrospirales bacterium NOB]|nr:MAG: hypothetical protein UZ03_NOB001000329 [Nitrospira sp. OLB3]MBV6471694.1 hypothetical protein [Nitrospirota bacterium]MCE7966917.1 hypothetical protein [Nitrospira sp. NTP2]MCK6500071.1 hypothetical protein [Nitrospira sp.]MDL1889719.1 hypothetical protein [Nitrospirales bacterium NOB]MEB2340256.1 hypothetical protein [Nitrospirales bacterium]